MKSIEKYLFIFLISLHFCIMVQSMNFDINDAIVKHLTSRNSKNKEGINQTYFGFSVLLHSAQSEFWLIAGAPFDTMEGLYGDQHDPSGTVYKCNLNNKNNDCKLVPTAFFSSDSDYNRNSLLGFNLLKIKNSNTDYVISCAPRKTDKKQEVVAGMCYIIPSSLMNVPPNDMVSVIKYQSVCSGAMRNSKDRQLRNCLFGYSVTQTGENYFTGAPYYKWGQGSIAMNSFARFSYPMDLPPPKTANNFSQGGYSLDSGKFFCKQDSSDCQGIAEGAPAVPTTGYDLPGSLAGNGLVYIGSYEKEKGLLNIKSEIYGDKFGSGFGHSVLAVDLNNDGYDDLLVGAPFYFNSSSKVVTGAVYLYMNEAGTMTQKIILSPERNQLMNSMFGMSLAQLGDINHDGYQDFAVGAPFEGNGSVYIYLGAESGLKLQSDKQYYQRIAASDIQTNLKSFGYSLSGNFDIDSNGYPDLAIGAPLSDKAVILRTRPIFQLKVYTFKLSAATVDPNEPFTLKMDYSFEWNDVSKSASCPSYSKPFVIDYWIDYDKEFSEADKRIALLGPSKSSGSYQVLCRETKSNILENSMNFKMQINNKFIDKVNPMLFSIRWQLRSELGDPPKGSRTVLSMNDYPMLDLSNNNITKVVHFSTCQPECKPKITHSVKLNEIKKADTETDYFIFIGKDEKILVDSYAKNLALLGDEKNFAYSLLLTVNYSKDFMQYQHNGNDMLRSKDFGDYAQVTCVLANPLRPQASSQCSFYLHIKPNLRETVKPYLMINTTLSYIVGANKVISAQKNFQLRIKMLTDIRVTIDGSGQQPYSHNHILGISGISQENQIGSRFIIDYEIKNELSNSIIPSSRFVLLWPVETVGNTRESHGKYLLYMLHPPEILSVNSTGKPHQVVCDSKVLKELVNPEKIRTLPMSEKGEYIQEGDVAMPEEFRLPPLDSDAGIVVNRVRKSKAPVSGSKTLKCLDGTARCKALPCRLPVLSKMGRPIKLRVTGRLWVYTMVEDYPNTRMVNINITALWKPDVNFDVVAKVGNNTFDVTIVAINDLPRGPTVSPNITLWVVLAVAAGLILLILVIIILWKLKFFQRAKLRRQPREPKNRLENYVYD